MTILISLSSPENSVQHATWGEAPEGDGHHFMINTSRIPGGYHLLLSLLEIGFALLALLLSVSYPALMVNALVRAHVRTKAGTYEPRTPCPQPFCPRALNCPSPQDTFRLSPEQGTRAPQLFLNFSHHLPPSSDPPALVTFPISGRHRSHAHPGRESHSSPVGHSTLPSPILRELRDTYLAVHFLQLLLAHRCFAILHGPQKELHV